MGATIEGITFNGGDAWDHVTFRGVTLEKRTVAFILAVEADLGHKLTMIQGSYNPGISASGGTHDEGGVFDCWDVFNSHPLVIQKCLRKHGGFGFYRKAIPNLWNEHIHCGVLGETDMSPTLAAQVPDYRNYLDGLASHAADNSWHPFNKGNDPRPTFDYPQWIKEQDMQPSDDAYPADSGNKTTYGDLWRHLDHLDEFRAEVKAEIDATNANVNDLQGRVKNRFDALETIVKAQADVTDKILAAVKP